MSQTNAPAGLSPVRLHALAGRLDHLLRTRLWAQIVAAMILGVTLGLGLSPRGGAWVAAETGEIIGAWLALPGQVFLALIQMIVVPLVVSSIVLGIAGGGSAEFVRRLGARIAPYFVATTVVAVLIGTLLVMWLAPGSHIELPTVPVAAELPAGAVSAPASASASASASAPGSLPEHIVAIIPANPGEAVLNRAMFQLAVLALLIAVALVSIPAERARPILDLCVSLQDVAMKVVGWAMVLAPAAVFGLLARLCIDMGVGAIGGMAAYVGTVLLGLLVLIGMYLLIVLILGRRNPREFLRAVRSVQLLAFSTSSSAAVMPLSMTTAINELGVRPAVAKFIVPLGTTVNMDGTALYQVSAILFLTQVYQIDLGTGQLLLLIVTTVGASIGSPGTPGVGIAILASIAAGIGIPAEGIALVIGVDRILDMCRTTVNVTGDLTACVVMDRWLPDIDTPAGPS
ncbi:MAG: dicarboxylate/amino acid:cation symporter [Gammaproteobacteria bacterium]|nr:dicarboxylate/amino acid:cation symporter [Gammaproteobacteria bacterium]